MQKQYVICNMKKYKNFCKKNIDKIIKKCYKHNYKLIIYISIVKLKFLKLMKLQKVLTGTSLVSLVFIPSAYVGSLMMPKYGEYEHQNIARIVPCEVVGDKFFDLRTGQQVQTDGNTQIWIACTGTVFAYPDGTELLIAKRYHDNKLICYQLEDESDFHEQTMLRRNVKS